MNLRAWLIGPLLLSSSLAWADYSLSLSANPGTVTDFTTHLTATDQNSLGRTVVSTNYNATGPAPVTFSNTSTYSADALFQAAGTYTLQIDQMDSNGIHGSGSVSVTVKPRTNSITITPHDPSIPYNSSQDFDAIATDQFGNPMDQSNFIWTDSNGNALSNLDANGVYQANQPHGHVIRAKYVLSGYPDIVSGFSEAKVVYPAPVIESFSAKQKAFDTVGAADLLASATSLPGEQYLIYTWNIPGASGIDSNGTNVGKQTVARFSSPGVYTYSLTVTDLSGQSTTSEVKSVTIKANYVVDLVPEGKSIALNSPIQLSATEKDQFGNSITASFNWVCTGPGTLDPVTHVLTATSLGTIPCTVTDPVTNASDTEPYFAENPSVQSLAITCQSAALNPGESIGCTGTATDQFGNPTTTDVVWSCDPGCGQSGTGSITPHAGDTMNATFLAGDGPYFLRVIGIGGGRRGEVNLQINTPPPPNNPPTISWTQPADGATFNQGDSITLEARAQDSDGTITAVSFQSQNGFIGSGLASGNDLYQNTWANVPAGVYTLTASAQDNRGGTAISSNITVTVLGPLSISGRVTESGAGIAGVSMTLSGGATQTVTTLGDGTYSFTNVPRGGNYTVTPAKANYGFTPANRTIANLSADQANVDFVATANRYSISGQVTEGGAGLAGVTMTLSGGASQTITTAADGSYSFSNLSVGADYTVTPAKADYLFAPVSRTVTALSADQTNINFAATANVFSISGTVTENGTGLAGVSLNLTGGTSQTVLTAADGSYSFTSLSAGQDYTVRPAKANYSFTPFNRTVTNLSANQGNVDFAATSTLPTLHSISGKVTENGVGLAGVGMTLSGGAVQNVITGADGTYTFTNLPNGGYTISPNKTLYTFNPAFRTVTSLTADQANVDFVATPNTFSISGKVTEGGVGLAGVTLTLSGGASQTATTSADGSYSFTHLTAQADYTVTPAKTNYSFVPSARTLTNLSADQSSVDFAATLNKFSISGKVTEAGVGLSGVTMTLSGGAAQTVTTAADGTYSFANLSASSDYTVTPSKTNYGFAPANRTLTNLSANQVTVDFAATLNKYTISGKVTEAGVGLAGVTLTLSGGASQTVTTGSDGTYSFVTLLAGLNYTVTPAKTNYTFAPVNRVLTNLSASQANVDFATTLNKYTISGKVTEGGVGLAGVTLTLSGGASQTATTAADGTYSFANLSAGSDYTVTPSKTNYGFAPTSRTLTNLSVNQTNVDFAATLNKYTISGKVTEAGIGLAGVTMTLSGGASQTVTTGSDGTYSFATLPAGLNYTVTPSKTNYGFTPVNRDLTNLSANQANIDFAATLNKYTISGKVTEGGVGLAGVTLTLSGGASQTATTAADGTYSFANLSASLEYTVTPSKTNYGFAPTSRTLTNLSVNQTNVDFVATANRNMISGKVTEGGVGLAGVTMTLSGGASQTTTTAADGSYSFANLLAGANYTVTPAKTNYTFAPVNRTLTNLVADLANVDFAATINKYSISGKVTEAGVGLSGVTLTLSGGANQTVTTGADGSYSFANLIAGLNYTVTPSKTNYGFAPVNRVLTNLSANQANVDFVATLNKYTISGKVTENGNGLAAVTMTLSGAASQTTTTASDGTYSFANLPAGVDYVVTPAKANYGFTPASRTLATLSANQPNVDFAATANRYSISGKVTENSTGLSGVTMTLAGGTAQTVTTAADGTYSFTNLLGSVNYTVTPSKTNYGFTPGNRTLTNLSGNQTNVDFAATLDRHSISGTVTENGVGLADVTLTLSGTGQTVTTAANGTYSFTNLPASADYTVTPSKPTYGFTPAQRVISNLSTNVNNIDFAATRNTYSISGHVLSQGKGLTDVTVTLSGSINRTQQTDADGAYSFSVLAAGGHYGVTVAKSSYTFTPTERTIDNLVTDHPGTDFVAVEDPRLSRIEVTPAELTVMVGESQHFEAKAYDQYGNVMNIPISWASNGGASISQSGAFQAVTVGRSFVIRAFSGELEGHALLNIIPVPISTDVSAAYAYPVPYKSTMGIPGITFANLGGQTHIRIYTAHGEQVTSLYTEDGSNVVWKVTNDSGSSVASGIYLYVIKSPTGEKRGKLIVIQ